MSENKYALIYELVRLIPVGRVTSYGAIADALGMPGGARMVGYAMGHSHDVSPEVPAHRVVNRIGLLTGRHHFSYPQEMEDLLKSEGVEILDNKVEKFENVFWDPKEIIKNL